jgi:2-oxoisovalerate dehydrogenase E1 component
VMGALNVPAIPMNTILEQEVLPNAKKLSARLKTLLQS